VQPRERLPHLKGMKLIAGISSEHRALLDKYQMALRLWSEVRGLYPPGTAEVLEAANHLETLEHALAAHEEPAVAA
jgi:hypothetical protein